MSNTERNSWDGSNETKAEESQNSDRNLKRERTLCWIITPFLYEYLTYLKYHIMNSWDGGNETKAEGSQNSDRNLKWKRTLCWILSPFLCEYPTYLKHHIVYAHAHIITVHIYQKVYLLIDDSLQPSIGLHDEVSQWSNHQQLITI